MKLRTSPVFEHVSWNPTREELRGFAVSMTVGFFVLGLLAAARAREIGTTSLVLWGIGAVLALAALIPRVGKISYLAVWIPTSLIGYVVSRVLLTVVFFGLFTPIALVLRARGVDSLQLRSGRSATWWRQREETPAPDSYYRQS